MIKTLVIYDTQGYVIQQISGDYRIPVGIPYLEVDVPEGKRVLTENGINVTANPHQPIFEDIPNYEIESIKEQLNAIQETLDFLLVASGGLNNG